MILSSVIGMIDDGLFLMDSGLSQIHDFLLLHSLNEFVGSENCFLLPELIWARVKGRVANLNIQTMSIEELKKIIWSVFSEVRELLYHSH